MSIEDIQIRALNTLIGGVRLAQSKGCYSLEEAGDINNAIKVFTSPQQVSQNESSSAPATTTSSGSKKKK